MDEDDLPPSRALAAALGSGDLGTTKILKRRDIIHMDRDQRLEFVKSLEGQVSISEHDTVYLVSYQLPVVVTRKEGGGWNVSKRVVVQDANLAKLAELSKMAKVVCVGWPGIHVISEKEQDAITAVLKEHNCIPVFPPRRVVVQDANLAKLAELSKMAKVVCVGWPGIHVISEKEQDAITAVLKEHNCIPVFPPRKDFDAFLSFCTTFLWPVFHDVMLSFQATNPRPFNEHGWAAYVDVNTIYAKTMVQYSHSTDLVWVHDYHLLMMPLFLSKKVQMANIGFYLHTPFPSSDSFKSLPVREELLSGMLCADLLGFQFFAYARNFLLACKRIYGLDPTFKPGGFVGLEYNGRQIMMKVAHVVYPFEEIREMVKGKKVLAKTTELRNLFEGKTIFACMDRCDGLSGLTSKCRAFRKFMKDYPQYRGKVVLIQYAYESPGYEDSGQYIETVRGHADVIMQTGENGTIQLVKKDEVGDTPEIFVRTESVEREDRLALFRAAHVLLDTSVKNGLNLMPFEFITAHFDDAKKHSISILSEFSGCSRVLTGSIRINAWNTAGVASTIESVLRMPDSERQTRFESNLAYLSDHFPMQWFEDFLTDLRRARKKEGMRSEHLGFGARMRQVCTDQGFQKLSIDQVLQSFSRSKRRMFFFDNEGTLAADKRGENREYGAPMGEVSDLRSYGVPPDESVLECLRTLCADSRNTVVILSGRDKELLEEWFGSVPRIGLAAEHGFYYKLPIVTGDEWHCMSQSPDCSWKSYAFELMRQFVKRTQGSRIESKGSALVWQYRDADQHFGSWQANELSSHLKELLFGFDVDVIDGKGYVEVKLRNINKGVAVAKALSKAAKMYGEADFVLCIGDDRSDEGMFEAINLFIDPSDALERDSQRSTTDDDGSSDGGNSVGVELAGHMRSSSAGGGGVSRSGGLHALSSVSEGTLEAGGIPQGLGQLKSKTFVNQFGVGSIATDLQSLGGSVLNNEGIARKYFTCTVGRKPSAARFFLHDTDEVSDLLQSLSMQQERRRTPFQYAERGSLTWHSGDPRRPMTMASMPCLTSLAFER
eukprot:gnl/TRDRNA2_/TRDRNA2_174638_c0_seq1.p1 gnl/TRDRNA2_/TRDRNA2_174638_c0~~gnl/TRDRNA2_/TRDRNA2_174638_c0_seq1.p1  ORF type:complete len:1066 (-),score=225.97 gnl/TRDRNA2_/TRDRNA2_174638_c0_seq1:70-3234(-)